MCDNDLDTILSYLSSKINKIFCDREFVGCVKEDFDIILRNTENHCVIFPKLKPIFLKVLRHQAVIFDLSVFCIGSGPNQLAVVCKKAFLNEQSDECPPEENKKESKTMDGVDHFDKANLKRANRPNRPTQTYYVPPAQRSTTKKKIHYENKTTNKTKIKFKSKHKSTEKPVIETEEVISAELLSTNTMCQDKMQEELVNDTSQLPNSIERKECGACLDAAQLPNGGQEEESAACSDVAQLPYNKEQEESEKTCLDVTELPNSKEKEEVIEGGNRAYLDVAQLPYSKEEEESAASLALQLPNNKKQESVEKYLGSLSLLNFSDEISQEEQLKKLPNELVQNYKDGSTTLDNISVTASTEINEQLRESQEFIEKNQNVKDIIAENSEESVNINMGLYPLPDLILQHCTNNPRLNAVVENLRIQQQTDTSTNNTTIPLLASNQDDKIIKDLETILLQPKMNGYIKEEILVKKLLTYFNTGNSVDKNLDLDPCGSFSLSNNVDDCNLNNDPLHIIPPTIQTQCDFSDVESSKQPLYISYNDDISKKKTENCEMDNENEEMQRVIENINRKSRSLIKHNIRNVNTLRIDENEHVPQHNTNVYDNNKKCLINTPESNCNKADHDNWEDMFDESGDLQPEYIGKIVKRIGCDVKIVKASHDYSAYENTKYQDLEHVIELYDFPSTFKTQDLIQLYRGAYQDAMYVKWCDDTHALLVLSSPAQAKRALQIKHEVIQARPLSQASTVAALTASSADLKPAMKRPQTNMQTARRMITTHLGTKSSLSKEEVEQERRALRDAREQRRQERQNEKDAWEGRPRSSKSHPLS